MSGGRRKWTQKRALPFTQTTSDDSRLLAEQGFVVDCVDGIDPYACAEGERDASRVHQQPGMPYHILVPPNETALLFLNLRSQTQ